MRTILASSAHESAQAVAPWLCEVFEAPSDVGELTKGMSTAENHLIIVDGTVVGWIGLVNMEEGGATLDLAIHPEWQKRWFTKGLIKPLGSALFGNNRKFVKLENMASKTLELALQIGAKVVYSEDMQVSTYLLTPQSYFKGTKQ